MNRSLLIAIFTLASLTASATIRNVPGTYATIQAGLNACLPGDTVLVQPGTYAGNIAWPAIAGIRLLSAGDSSNTIIDGGGTATVVTINTAVADTNTVIRGFSIVNGYTNTTWSDAGGVLVEKGGIRITECVIRDNHPGGSNTNWCYGGGLQVSAGITLVENSSIRDNTANSNIYGFGGGVHVESNATLYLKNTEVRDNMNVAGNYCYGGGIYCQGVLNMTDCSIEGNTTQSGGYNFGGGLFMSGGLALLVNVKILDNDLSGSPNYNWGGGLYMRFEARINLANVLIANNQLSNSTFINEGGGIYIQDSLTELTAVHITVAGNRRWDGGTVAGSGLRVESGAVAHLANSIFYNANSGPELSLLAGGIDVTNSDIRNGYAGTLVIDTLPGFVSATDFHLQANSPCLGQGKNSNIPPFDLDNSPRPLPVGTFPDLGCYELNQPLGIPEGLAFAASVFPNPVQDILYVRVTAATEITLFDALGRQSGSWHAAPGLSSIDCSTLAPGTYLVRWVSGYGGGNSTILKR